MLYKEKMMKSKSIAKKVKAGVGRQGTEDKTIKYNPGGLMPIGSESKMNICGCLYNTN